MLTWGGLGTQFEPDKNTRRALIDGLGEAVIVSAETSAKIAIEVGKEFIPYGKVGTLLVKGGKVFYKTGKGLVELGREALSKARKYLAAGDNVDQYAAQQIFKNSDEVVAFLKTKCFARDTLVSTEAGLRPIGSIQIGQNVHSFDFETGQWELRTVTDRIDSLYEGQSSRSWQETRASKRLFTIPSGL